MMPGTLLEAWSERWKGSSRWTPPSGLFRLGRRYSPGWQLRNSCLLICWNYNPTRHHRNISAISNRHHINVVGSRMKNISEDLWSLADVYVLRVSLFWWGYVWSASFDFPVVDLGNPANARPAVLLHGGEVFEALEINGDISSLLLCSLFADGVGFVDVIDASDLQVVGAVGRQGQGEQSQQQDNQLHSW